MADRDDQADGEHLSADKEAMVVENEALRAENVELKKMVAALEKKVADLEARLGRNPRNSSMPPSAEGLTKPPAPNRADRRAAKRRPGKQPGDPGHHLARVDDPGRDRCAPGPTVCGL